MLLDFNKLITKYNMKINGVIHIGGHHGQEYKLYREHPNIKNIVFFEPDPDSFNILRETTSGDDLVTTINTALGPFSCKASMHKETANDGQSNSILEPGLHLRQYPNITFDDKYKVSVHPLDRYQPNKSLNLINIDVQGFELQVFLGASRTLNNVDYIITEVNRDEVYKNCARVEDLDYFLGKYGFKRVETSWEGITWGDALYIKS
jgi:FkbM family methyltransferase|tara:strand:+ start:894 stop:1511 length:618 start_codon:yes stop_codon:yes gene_type:complete